MKWQKLLLPSRALFLLPFLGGITSTLLGTFFGWADAKTAEPMYTSPGHFATGLMWICVVGAPVWWTLAALSLVAETVWKHYGPPVDRLFRDR